MVSVDTDLIESVGFVDTTHCMFIKFKDGKTEFKPGITLTLRPFPGTLASRWKLGFTATL